jgi:hypothetical protein
MHQNRSNYCKRVISNKLNDKVNNDNDDMKTGRNALSSSNCNVINNLDSSPSNNDEISGITNLHHLQHTTIFHADLSPPNVHFVCIGGDKYTQNSINKLQCMHVILTTKWQIMIGQQEMYMVGDK